MPPAGSGTEQISSVSTGLFRGARRIVTAALASEAAQSLLGVLDQGVVALAAAIPVVVLGRLAGASDLGRYSLAISAGLFATIAIQSLFLAGYPIFRVRDQATADLQTFHVVFFGFATQALIAPFCLWVLTVFAHPGLSLGLAMAAFATTNVLRTYLRALSLVRRDLFLILALDFGALVLVAALLAIILMHGAIAAAVLFVALTAVNALFVAAWCACYAGNLRLSLVGTNAYLRRLTRFGGWAFASVTFGSMPYYLTPWILAFVQGDGATGVYAAGSTIASLVNHAMLGLLRGVEARTAEAFRHGPAQLQAALFTTFRIVLPALLPIVAVIIFVAGFAGEVILPGRGGEAGAVARLLSLALVIGSVRVVVGNGLWAMGLPQATLRADLFRGIASVGLAIVGAHYAGALGCASAILVGDVGSSLIVVGRYRAEIRAARPGSG